MKIIDLYIIKKYLGTFGFMLGLLTIIVLVIDVQAKAPRIESNGFTVTEFLINFYPYWIVNLIITFMSILVFISVIFFTSRIANDTEIVAIISSGASFHRFARPYLMTSGLIAIFALLLNHYVLPLANIKKNELEPYTYTTMAREEFTGSSEVSTQLSKTEYIFVKSYNKKEKRGSGFIYQKFDKNRKLIYQLNATDFNWDNSKKLFILNNFFTKTINKDETEKLGNGTVMEKSFIHPPEELFPDVLLGQNKTTPDLIKFIDREKEKGNGNLNNYLNELYQRTSMPVSVIILTFLGLSLSSQKKRGGLGVNLAIGIALAFVFVFSFEALKVVSANKTLTPLLAMWLPNLVFGPVAVYLYFKRANQ
ncbi:LptF/LptG family permease [Kaistella jeonii]|uniref:Permease n=1 Tax=Kaistella jeonii TaxID=266749 RepID=A0A0C1FQ77_9FLAO|nr:LptF/LptG family permease [Kaistella jeonii]KIA90024.1 permease [Kaistella jeonii]SFB79037.1 lipopolysaccharide export system permease protein [Kaistella jeonii]VEI96291.1 lipopolysaccharide ABC transporter permease [Kaistella jeonii]